MTVRDRLTKTLQVAGALLRRSSMVIEALVAQFPVSLKVKENLDAPYRGF